jgi:purine-nucleoside phosphorylase
MLPNHAFFSYAYPADCFVFFSHNVEQILKKQVQSQDNTIRGNTMEMNVLNAAADTVFEKLGIKEAHCVLILGSGWSDVAKAFEVVAEIPYQEIPGLGAAGVSGHAGILRHCRVEEKSVLIFQGRRHWYEGSGWIPITIPVYIAARAGVETALITNAAGGIAAGLAPGDLMMITDHINAMGSNPLIGAHDEIWGPRFPDQSHIYRDDLQTILREAALTTGATLKDGVYIATSGPTYETPAEIRSYRMMGADAVGMSTVPEAILANAAGIKVAAVSCITNFAAGVSESALGHAEVLETTRRVMPVMTQLIAEFVRQVSSKGA